MGRQKSSFTYKQIINQLHQHIKDKKVYIGEYNYIK